MLVVSRAKGESIWITAPGQPTIKIVVVDTRGNSIRLGVEADRQFGVVRGELVGDVPAGPQELPPRPARGHHARAEHGNGRRRMPR